MIDALYRYFSLYHHLSIPGVGTLQMQLLPSRLEENTVHGPDYQVSFIAGTALTEKHFYGFLSNALGVTEVEAVRKYQDFAYQLKQDIQHHTSVTFAGLGKFNRSATGEIRFENSWQLQSYFAPVSLSALPATATPSIQQEAAEEEHTIEVEDEMPLATRDRWWIWALVLAILGLAAIAYFYMEEGAI